MSSRQNKSEHYKMSASDKIEKNAGSKTQVRESVAPNNNGEVLKAFAELKSELVETLKDLPTQGQHSGHQHIDHNTGTSPSGAAPSAPPDTVPLLNRVQFKPKGWEGDYRPVYLSAEVVGDVFSKVRYPYLRPESRFRLNAFLKMIQLFTLCFPAIMILSSAGREGEYCTYLARDTVETKTYDYDSKTYKYVPHQHGFSGKVQCAKHQTERLLERYRVDSLAAGPMLQGLGNFKNKDRCGYLDPKLTSKSSEEAKEFMHGLMRYGYADGRPYSLEERETSAHIRVCTMEPAVLTVAGTSTTIENIILVAMLLLYALFMFTPEPDYQLFTVAYVCSTVLAGFMVSSTSIIISRFMAYATRFAVHLYSRRKGYTSFNMDDMAEDFEVARNIAKERADRDSANDSNSDIEGEPPKRPVKRNIIGSDEFTFSRKNYNRKSLVDRV